MAAMRLIKIPSIENTNPREMRRGAGEDYANVVCEARRAHSPGGDELRCCSCGARAPHALLRLLATREHTVP